MKSVCLKCNRPLALHPKITAELVAATAIATYERPIRGHYAPIYPTCIGQWLNHDPLMSTIEPTWPTPFGTSEL